MTFFHILKFGTDFTLYKITKSLFINQQKTTKMSKKRNGILALLGLGALAWWRYKNATPEEQKIVKDKVNTAKDNITKWGKEMQTKAEDLSKKAQEKIDEQTKK